MKYLIVICVTALLISAMKYVEPIIEKRIEFVILYQLTQLQKRPLPELNKL